MAVKKTVKKKAGKPIPKALKKMLDKVKPIKRIKTEIRLKPNGMETRIGTFRFKEFDKPIGPDGMQDLVVGLPKGYTNILEEAQFIIYGDREKTYGAPDRNLKAIADYWTVHLRHKYGFTHELTTDDVCQLMIALKQARLLFTPTHHDSQVDTAGYMALMNRVQNL